MPNFFSSNTRYLGFASQTTFDTAAGSAGAYLRMVKEQTTCEWVRNFQQLRTGYGDVYGDSDLEEVNPKGMISIVHPLTPSTLSAFLALCGITPGASTLYKGVGAPGLVTFFDGLGVSEEVYFNSSIQSVRFAASRRQPRWMATFTFVAGDITPDGTPATPTAVNTKVLAYEKAWHFSNLSSTGLLGGMTEAGTPAAKLDSIQLDITFMNEGVFLGRVDGRDRISDFVLEDITAQMQITRAFNSTTERDKYLTACNGFEGSATISLLQDVACGTHLFGWEIPRGKYTVDKVTSPDKSYIGSAMTIKALRNNAGLVTDTSAATFAPVAFIAA